MPRRKPEDPRVLKVAIPLRQYQDHPDRDSVKVLAAIKRDAILEVAKVLRPVVDGAVLHQSLKNVLHIEMVVSIRDEKGNPVED